MPEQQRVVIINRAMRRIVEIASATWAWMTRPFR